VGIIPYCAKAFIAENENELVKKMGEVNKS